MSVMSISERLRQRIPGEVLSGMIHYPLGGSSDIPQRLENFIDYLNLAGNDRYGYLFDDNNGDGFNVHLQVTRHGVTSTKTISHEFFDTREYQEIRQLADNLDGLLGEDATVERGDQVHKVDNFEEVMKWILDQARKGQSIQRYKGLGEMNPDQLWETTLDPDTRRLLQVRVEDAIAADEIFTTLMGDNVEPRREFIESNALSAVNIDI